MPAFIVRDRDRNEYLTLESQEWHSVAHHLRVAATRYDVDAQTMEEEKQSRLADTFREQAKQARTLAEQIEELS